MDVVVIRIVAACVLAVLVVVVPDFGGESGIVCEIMGCSVKIPKAGTTLGPVEDVSPAASTVVATG